MSDPTIQQVADMLDPGDGYRVISSQVGNLIMLHLGFYHEGELIHLPRIDITPEGTFEVYRKLDPSPSDFGDMARIRLLLDAFCRYMNTGGMPEDIASVAVTISRVVGNTQLLLPGLDLVSSAFNSEGRAEHLFLREGSHSALRWVENDFVDVVSLSDLDRELQEGEESDVIINDGSNPALMSLLHRQGAGDAYGDSQRDHGQIS